MPISHLLAESFYHPGPSEDNVDVDPNYFHFEHHPDLTHGNLSLDTLTINPVATEVHRQQSEKFVLIDTDAGTDDAWAIFMALAAKRDSTGPPFNIVGITTVYGNTPVKNVANNVTRTLDTVHETTIPIFKGMDGSMIGRFEHAKDEFVYNGVDGFGDANLPAIPTRLQPEHSVEAIIKFAEAYKGRLTIMCIGPLTNLAMALKLRPEIRNYIKEILILGGNIAGIGNVTVSSEFNFFVDPEAAKVVLESFSPCPITILPWETCLKFATCGHDWRTNVLGNMRTHEIGLLNKIEAKILNYNKENWMVSDAVLAACVINPRVVKKTESYYCTVELQGNMTRGMMIVDRNFLTQKPSNVTIITEVDQSLYESMLIWAAGGPGYKSHPNGMHTR